MKPLPSSGRYAGWLALVRILTGVAWLSHGIPKFVQSAQFMPPNGFFADFVTRGVQATTGPYHTFLATSVQPYMPLFAELVRLGEVLVGISLVLGAFTRLGGLVGVLLPLNYLAARGHMFSSATLQSVDFATGLLSLISLVLPTGRFLGVDALFTRSRRPPPVRAEFVPEPPLDRPTASPNP
jgi:thiosulfate dehydrogenase (quinone) large subunit